VVGAVHSQVGDHPVPRHAMTKSDGGQQRNNQPTNGGAAAAAAQQREVGGSLATPCQRGDAYLGGGTIQQWEGRFV